jgi:hypothetical protein
MVLVAPEAPDTVLNPPTMTPDTMMARLAITVMCLLILIPYPPQ